MSSDSYQAVTDYSLLNYPCGLSVGDQLRLKFDIHVQNHMGEETGEILHRGEVWTVLPGVQTEPNIIWLKQPDGERHTWDDSIFDTFEKLNS